MSMDTLLVRGSMAALLVVGALHEGRAQVVAVPARPVKDSVFVKMITTHGDSVRVVRISSDSIRELLRAWEMEPLLSHQSKMMSRELDALAAKIRANFGNGGPGIIITDGPDGFRQLASGFARGWIGITTGGVHNDRGEFVQYLDYPPILSVERKSPAQLAGIVPGDTLIAYDGQDVVAHAINKAQLLTPDKRIAVTVRRDGEDRAFMVTVARAPGSVFSRRMWEGDVPPPPDAPRGDKFFDMPIGPAMRGQILLFATGVFGANVSNVGPELSKKLMIEQGILVNEVPEDSPASRIGLKVGDVIVAVAGEPVTRVEEVRKLAAMRGDGRPLELKVIRDKKSRTLTVR
jgi:membrane-associated protease RseP (regulator of RpoE activity)